ncbi:MAG: hypothetical protein HC869_02570 [Rhodospirillales bacterium]|nr:hypothetical protein [Rhodospirillales bacterium]
MKTKIGVYLTNDVAKRLKMAVRRSGATKSDIDNEALARFLDPMLEKDPGEEVLKRLSGMARSLRRIHREVEVVAETLALHVRQFLMITPPLPESEQHDAEKLGRERYQVFVTQIAKRIAADSGLVSEIMQRVAETNRDRAAPQPVADGAMPRHTAHPREAAPHG